MFIEFTDAEVAVLQNCITETFEAVAEFELQLRTGANAADLRLLRAKLDEARTRPGTAGDAC